MILAAAKPEDGARQTMLAGVLAARLQQDPDLVQQLFDILGKERVVQQVLADRSSWVKSVVQRIKGNGTQTVQANQDSVIVGVHQTKDQLPTLLHVSRTVGGT